MSASLESRNRFHELAEIDINELMRRYGTDDNGGQTKNHQNRQSRPDYSSDIESLKICFKRAFINPFTVILAIVATVSLVADVIFTSNYARSSSTFPTFILMIFVSGIVRLLFELRARKEADIQTAHLRSTSEILQNGIVKRIPSSQLKEGDIIFLNAGDVVPADIRLLSTSHLHVSQGALSGEGSSVLKQANAPAASRIFDCKNLVMAQSTVIGGWAKGLVIAVGKNCYCAQNAEKKKYQRKSFEKGAHEIAAILLRFMCILVPCVMIISGFSSGQWLASFLFALSVAVGLTPELLPMVCTICLARGSYLISRRRVIVKNINAIQALGSIDVLCIDKTGTLTNITPVLEYMTDVFGNDSAKVLDYAFLNSELHSGVDNPVDQAIRKVKTIPDQALHFQKIIQTSIKLSEVPFDYERKFVSVLVRRSSGKHELIVKGNIESVFEHCSFVETPDGRIPIDKSGKESVHAVVDEMLADGMKVIAVAYKSMGTESQYTEEDENGLTLLGYLAFFDAPKSTAKDSIEKLTTHHVTPKILTGDTALTTISICKRVGIPTDSIVSGALLERMSTQELSVAVEKNSVFVELSPQQKGAVVRALKHNGHIVGFLGDGLNDSVALSEADAGISVDTAVSGAKASADILLLEKDLNILEDGIREGRRTFVNMQKYIKITASSNLGNILTIVFACAFLPFYPMAGVQILLLTLLYDLICIALPWDKVDAEEIDHPKDWSGRGLVRFMLTFGPLSSLFDLITFGFLYFYLCPLLTNGQLFHELTSAQDQSLYMMTFQTGWFLESLWSQVLILLFLRTRKIPFVSSYPSKMVLSITTLGLMIFTGLALSPLAVHVGFIQIPSIFFGFLATIVLAYMLITTLAKNLYQKCFNSLI